MSTLADDLLPGAKKNASYVYGVDDKRHQRKIYHKYETREKKDGWPLWKDGQDIVSRKSLLDQHFNPKPKMEAAE